MRVCCTADDRASRPQPPRLQWSAGSGGERAGGGSTEVFEPNVLSNSPRLLHRDAPPCMSRAAAADETNASGQIPAWRITAHKFTPTKESVGCADGSGGPAGYAIMAAGLREVKRCTDGSGFYPMGNV